jgi:hypothetical protein
VALGHRNTTAVVTSTVETITSKCGRVIFSASGEGDVYGIEREGGGTETLKTEKAITKQCYLNESGVGCKSDIDG